jgi:hypothetical protein
LIKTTIGNGSPKNQSLFGIFNLIKGIVNQLRLVTVSCHKVDVDFELCIIEIYHQFMMDGSHGSRLVNKTEALNHWEQFLVYSILE